MAVGLVLGGSEGFLGVDSGLDRLDALVEILGEEMGEVDLFSNTGVGDFVLLQVELMSVSLTEVGDFTVLLFSLEVAFIT